MAIFYLKHRDTRPILEAALEEPDPDNPGALRAVDLSAASSVMLHVMLADGTVVSRAMVVVAPASSGIVRYTWLPTDWDAGNLVPTPEIPPALGEHEHRMEYEVIGAFGVRQTYPNDGWDTLRIYEDLGQG